MTLITQPEVQGNGTDVTNEQVILLGMVLILIEEVILLGMVLILIEEEALATGRGEGDSH